MKTIDKKPKKLSVLNKILILLAFAAFFVPVTVFFGGGVLYKYINDHFQEDKDCKINSVELRDDNVGGGSVSVTKKVISVKTADCGDGYIDNVTDQGVTFKELADILERNEGESVSLSIGILNWDGDSYIKKVNGLDQLR
ncbi:hypothetical protein [uncultured Kocuria sp.]|uniref:hypothetical protein n=1 Tax=uncultured Kocuria sp. TaxID=259305 RepID=UPI00066188B4|nr:hypothetical protein [uncultured Kocuria sp.]MCT1368067.1 MICOS complex subunit MIC60 [Rothia sp. p3-SID1597]